MQKLFKTLMVVLLITGTACTIQAQQEEDKKIKVKITREVDGETQTFQGEYASEEEMMADPEYREFAGKEESAFWLDIDEDMDRVIELRSGPHGRAFSFRFDDEEFDRKFRKGFRPHQGGPRAFFFDEDMAFDFHLDSEAFEKELEEKMKKLEESLDGLDKDQKVKIMKSVEEIQEMSSGFGKPKRIKRKSISVEEVGDDFGKKGRVNEKDELKPEDIDFMVMGGRMNLRFRLKDAGELSVNISNTDGKNIYSRYFENFQGTFTDRIDFTKYSEGKYLLEIQQDKQRLTRKIVID